MGAGSGESTFMTNGDIKKLVTSDPSLFTQEAEGFLSCGYPSRTLQNHEILMIRNPFFRNQWFLQICIYIYIYTHTYIYIYTYVWTFQMRLGVSKIGAVVS